MQKAVELANKLEKTHLKEISEWVLDFSRYFEKEECLQLQEQALDLIKEIELKLEEAVNKQTIFNFYLSSYFKGNQNNDENSIKQAVAINLKQLCNIIYQHKGNSQYNQNEKQILIQEYFSLHNQIQQSVSLNDHKFSKNKEIYHFKSNHANEFYQNYLKEIISQQGNSQKIFWTDFKALFVTYLKDIFNFKFKNEYNFNDLATYLKQLIDYKEDNSIDLEEIDHFFYKYLNVQNFQVDDLYKLVEDKMYKLVNNNLSIEVVKYPTKYDAFYKGNNIKFNINSYQDRLTFGRKAETKINTLQIFPEEESSISRQQFQIFKDDLQNYYLENLHQSIQMSIRVTDVRQNVRKGYTYIIAKKQHIYIEDIVPQGLYPQQQGSTLLNLQTEQPFVELKADLSQSTQQSQEKDGFKNQSIHFKYNNIRYLCTSQKFTIGKSLSDDIQIDNADEEQQIAFEYIQNCGWVVYEPKPSKSGTFLKVSQNGHASQDDIKQKKDVDFNATYFQQQYNPKFQIFDGIQFSFADYEFRFKFSK